MIPAFNELSDAVKRLESIVHRTPVLTSRSLNDLSGVSLFFKCENFQKVGAFKFRGAANAVLQLSETERKLGVATHSSGNFAQALALAAKNSGMKAHIVMPENASHVKKQAVLGYGARVISCNSTLKDREITLSQVVEETGAVIIHSYNNLKVIIGNATACMEMINDTGALDVVIAPVGGGGLISGTAIASNYLLPETKIFAAEPFGADDAYRSFHKGEIVPSINPQTIADGLRTSLGDITFPIIKELLTDIIRVEEDEIINAMKLLWERMKIIVEPSAAVAFAAVLREKKKFAGKRVGIILSGGNVDLENIPF